MHYLKSLYLHLPPFYRQSHDVKPKLVLHSLLHVDISPVADTIPLGWLEPSLDLADCQCLFKEGYSSPSIAQVYTFILTSHTSKVLGIAIENKIIGVLGLLLKKCLYNFRRGSFCTKKGEKTGVDKLAQVIEEQTH